ncbi:MAG: hypothetical protein GTO41_22060 [Burkholderiales bacterium]|nr:hypothetical protein [Burkholderiales bacterium]
MSTTTILVFAIIVFALMTTGLILTMFTFNQMSVDPSIYKGADIANREPKPTESAKLNVVENEERAG